MWRTLRNRLLTRAARLHSENRKYFRPASLFFPVSPCSLPPLCSQNCQDGATPAKGVTTFLGFSLCLCVSVVNIVFQVREP